MLEVVTDNRDLGNGFYAITERVDQFVEKQRQIQEKTDLENRRSNHRISDLIKKSKSLSPEIVDKIFNPYIQQQINNESILAVRKKLHAMRLKINTLEPKKRFLVLETMDFFRSKISIGKLIPAILLLQGDDKKKAFLQFVAPTFQSINKNIEILVSTKELFDERTLHLNRGSLYSFLSDLAKIIIPAFKEDYLEKFENIVSPVELLDYAISPFYSKSAIESKSLHTKLVDDEEKIRNILLDFIVAIQSHDALFNYSIKRHGYYKLFLINLTNEDRFQDYPPILVSKILAGCFLANQQLKPSQGLIDAMVDEKKFSAPATTKAKKSFINHLAPSTILKIISNFKTYFKLLLNADQPTESFEMPDLSVKSILKQVWSGFTKLAEEGFTMISAPLEFILGQIKRVYRAFIEDEQKAEEQVKREINKPLNTLIPKRSEHLAYLKRNYSMVSPSIVGFRGIREGANQKDFAYNSRFFNRGEIIQLEFTYCFKRLFEFLLENNNKKVKVLTHDRQKGIIEYHLSMYFDRHLINFGLIRLKSETNDEIQEKDIFPYVLLFSETEDAKKGRLASRKATVRGKQRTFSETVLSKEKMKLVYKSLLYALHLLPAKDWNATTSQACIKFIIKELKNVSSSS